MNQDPIPTVQNALPGTEGMEQRLALMQELAGSLERSQAAVVRSDRAGIDNCSSQQLAICEAVRRLESSVGPLGSDMAKRTALDPASALACQRREVIAKELREVEDRVRQLNRVYGALLRRAGRTLDIFRRVLESSALTYTPPLPGPALAAPTLGWEEAGRV